MLWRPAPGPPPPARTCAIKSFFSASGSCSRLALSGTSVFSSMSDFLSSFGSYRSTASGARSVRRPLLGRTQSPSGVLCVLPKSNSRRASPFQATKQFTQKMSQRHGNIKTLLRRGRGYKNLRYLLLKAQRLAATKTEFVAFEKAA